MKTFKRTLSLVLAVCILASMAVIATVSVAAVEKSATSTRPVITDVVNSDPEIQVGTKRYYFYMPDSWYNEKNDNYDGESLESCAAGIYWWSSTYNSDDYKGENAQGWPGFLILDNLADEGFPNIFYADVPEDATTIIFNNTVDGGQDETAPGWGYNAQTIDIKTKYLEEDDPYGFYETLDSMDGMIYVVNPLDTTVSDFSGATTTKGDWFYYYGDGTYGTTPEKGDVFFNNGDFPSALDISVTGTVLYPNEDNYVDIYTNAPAEELQAYSLIEVADGEYDDNPIIDVGAIESVTGDAKYKSKVRVTALQEGDAVVTFMQTTEKDDGSFEQAIRTCNITVAYARPTVTSAAKSIYIGKTAKPFTVKKAMTVSYKSNKTSVATVDKNGKVTGKAAGTATITCTAKAGSYTVTQTAKVTVKKLANTMTVKAKTVTAKAAKNTSVAAAKIATVKKAVGKVTYKKTSGDKKITVASNGKMTVKKGLKKGKTYTVKVKVTAAGSAKYASLAKTISVKVKVK